jgi:diguanylate cyclase (GGDEF)-like protein
MIPFVAPDSALPPLEAALSLPDDAARCDAGIALAWLLRQRHTARALELAEQAERRAAPAAASAPREHAARIARLQLVRGEAAWLQGRLDDGWRHARQAERHAREAGNPIAQADTHWLLAMLHGEAGEMQVLDEQLARMAACAVQVQDAEREAIAQAARARWATLHSPPEARRQWARLADAQHEPATAGARVWVRDFRGAMAFAEGDYGTAALHQIPMIDEALATGQLQRAIVALTNVGIGLSKLHDQEAALQWMERALDLARRMAWPPCVTLCLAQTAYTQCMLGRFDAAIELLQEARQMLTAPHSRTAAMIVRYTAEAQQGRGEHAAALAGFTELIELSHHLQQPGMRAIGEAGRAVALANLGRAEEAVQVAQAALADCRATGQRCDEIDLLRRIAQIHAEHTDAQGRPLGGPDAALHWFDELLRVAQTFDGYTMPGEVYDQIAKEHARRGDHAKAYEAALQAAAAREKTSSAAAVNRSIAMQITHQTERARAEAQHHRELARTLQQTTDTLERLSTIGQEITQHLDEARVIATLNEHVHGLLDATHFAVYLLDDAGHALDCAFGVEGGLPLPPLRIALDDAVSLVARCARERQEVVRLHAPAGHNPHHIPGTLPSASALFAPLVVGERLLGVLSVQSLREQAYGERERLILRTLCAYGAIALDNARGYRRLEATLGALRDTERELVEKNRLLEAAYRQQEDASLTDPLTRLRNRRFLVQHIDGEVGITLRRHARAQRVPEHGPVKDTDLAFYMIDVDHFKTVNDEHGHAAGDRVLVQVAERLRRVARDTDYLVRWGGEEFLLVARATNAEAATHLAERLRAAIAGEPFELDHGVALWRTCSVGFACLPFWPAHPGALGWSQVVALADHALYVAKREGRDRWVGAYPGTEPAAPGDALIGRLTAEPGEAVAQGLLSLLRSAMPGRVCIEPRAPSMQAAS